MRGFRGSRAAQNFNSRFDRLHDRKTQKERFLRLVDQSAQPKVPPKLPEWLKGLEEKPKPQAAQAQPEPVQARPESKALPSNVVPIASAPKKLAPKVKTKARPKAKAPVRKAATKRKSK